MSDDHDEQPPYEDHDPQSELAREALEMLKSLPKPMAYVEPPPLTEEQALARYASQCESRIQMIAMQIMVGLVVANGLDKQYGAPYFASIALTNAAAFVAACEERPKIDGPGDFCCG